MCLPEKNPPPGIDLIEVACPVCASRETQPYVARFLGSCWPPLQTVRCRRCQLVYVNPRPSRKQTESGYRDLGSDPAHDSEFPTLQSTRYEGAILFWLEKMMACRSGLRILDFGCGYGDFLRLARLRGHKVYGVEIARGRAAYVRDVLGIAVHQGELTADSLAPGYFDVVYASQVFEHLDAPRATLLQLAAALREGGMVCLSVPNIQCLSERRQRGALLDSGHLSYFSAHSMRCLVQSCGLTPLYLSAGVGAFAAWCRLTASERLLYWLYRGLKTATAPLQCGSNVFVIAGKGRAEPSCA